MRMKRILKKAHRYFYLISVLFYLGVFYPFLYFFSRKESRFPTLNRLRRIYSFIAPFTTGIVFNYSFEKPIDWSKHYIICANHTSNLDIPAITYMVKGNFAFMGKDELLNNPVTGLFFKTIDIPLKRDSKMSAFRAFKRAEAYLEKNVSLVIFPEGGISDNFPPQLGGFKNGPFRLAIEQNVQIIPVSITDNYKKMWDDGSKYGSRPGICHICVHAPVVTDGLTIRDTDELQSRIYHIINSKLV